jgi:hypothetical protein
MKYPIGIQNFGEIRRGGYVYVDKTPQMWKMIDEGKYYFLSRPRRFGKSLMISTLEAFFSGERELFKGLFIDTVEWDWKQYPIMHLDLNTDKYDSPEVLTNRLEKFLSENEEIYGRKDYEKSFGARFEGLMKRAFEQTGCQVVVLVDEYDKPMLQAIENEELQSEYRSTLKAFYGALKSSDRYIKFAFLTGVTKFGKVSVFSDLNNLIDLSLDHRYTNICGISEKEMHDYFDADIAALAEANGLTKDECYERLRRDFDGYHFSRLSKEGMYNPFSVLNTLSSQVFNNYWFETGMTKYIFSQILAQNFLLDEVADEPLCDFQLHILEEEHNSIVQQLYQSGYLSIKDYDEEFKLYYLGFPNREVKEGLKKAYMNYIACDKVCQAF